LLGRIRVDTIFHFIHLASPHLLLTPPQAPAGAPPDVWCQLLSSFEGGTGAVQNTAARDVTLEPQQQQEEQDQEELAEPQQALPHPAPHQEQEEDVSLANAG